MTPAPVYGPPKNNTVVVALAAVAGLAVLGVIGFLLMGRGGDKAVAASATTTRVPSATATASAANNPEEDEASRGSQ